ncbi:MAG: hypothetical protein HUJ54_11040 [Erysipelotrichaceae bacterium]|nr:hypothetical protein [Erysipelotrichaceae bacterium]
MEMGAVMLNYGKGILWFVLALVFCTLAGAGWSKKGQSFPRYFLNGFLIYSFGAALIGMAARFLQLSYFLFMTGMWLWLIGLAVLSTAKVYSKYRFSFLNGEKAKEFFRSYWALFLILALIMTVVVLLYPVYWLQNHTDDGFYLTQMASLPYMEHPFRDNAASGLIQNFFVDAYTINTHELEASFYIYVLQIPAALFARFFLAAFQYFIFLCCIYVVAQELFKAAKVSNTRVLQWVPMIALFFLCDNYWLRGQLLNVQDSWQFCSAMYYGSSLVRVCGVFLLIYPYLFRQELNWKVFARTLAVSFILMAKSTIALPVIFVAAAAYLSVCFLKNKNLWVKLAVPLLFAAIYLAGLLLERMLPGMGEMGSEIAGTINWGCIQGSAQFQYLIIKLGLIAVLSLLLIRKAPVSWAIVFTALSIVLLVCPGLNKITGALSVYSFVIGRAITGFVYFILVLGFAGIWLWLALGFRRQPGAVFLLGGASAACLYGVCLFSTAATGASPEALANPDAEVRGIDLMQAVRIYISDPYLINREFVKAGQALTELDHGSGRVVAASPRVWETDELSDYSSLVTRAVAPTVKAVTVNYRFPTSDDPVYGSFEDEAHAVVDLLFNDMSSDFNIGRVQELLSQYPINTFLFKTAQDPEPAMNYLGFHKYWEARDPRSDQTYFIYTTLEN